MLREETVRLLKPTGGRVIIDGTLGGGGHSEALLEAGATVVGLDRDPVALSAASARLARFGDRFRAIEGTFSDVLSLVETPVDGFLLDLGVSSPQLDTPERGFSFQHDGPLDMRMGKDGLTAAELIAQTPEGELADLIFTLGEERYSRPIARELKKRNPATTAQACDAVKAAVPRRAWPERTHVATKTFQALRMAVNAELEQLDAALAAVPELLSVGGVAAIISFHSLEDRRVKLAFRALCGAGPSDVPRGLPVPAAKAADFVALTKKAVVAEDAETETNPRARSARLRAVEKVS